MPAACGLVHMHRSCCVIAKESVEAPPLRVYQPRSRNRLQQTGMYRLVLLLQRPAQTLLMLQHTLARPPLQRPGLGQRRRQAPLDVLSSEPTLMTPLLPMMTPPLRADRNQLSSGAIHALLAGSPSAMQRWQRPIRARAAAPAEELAATAHAARVIVASISTPRLWHSRRMQFAHGQLCRSTDEHHVTSSDNTTSPYTQPSQMPSTSGWATSCAHAQHLVNCSDSDAMETAKLVSRSTPPAKAQSGCTKMGTPGPVRSAPDGSEVWSPRWGTA